MRHSGPIVDLAYSPDGRLIASRAVHTQERHKHELRLSNVETGECIEHFTGIGDARAVAGGAERFPFLAWFRGLETAIETATSRKAVAWYPARLRRIVTHPSGRRWSGISMGGQRLNLLQLEGDTSGHEAPDGSIERE
jgi:hypothetical protein